MFYRLCSWITLVFILELIVPFISSAAADSACVMCHRTQEHTSTHKGFDQAGCQSCHGESGAHMRSPRAESPDFSFMGDDGSGSQCLACHEGSGMAHWSGGEHEMAGVDCQQCHRVHDTDAATSASRQALCLDCHPTVKASLHLPSRHPILEGSMLCTSCHEPHGSANQSLLKGILPTDTCIDCHQDLRSPRLFEHEPVTEDCGLCHAPHGSAISGMLKSRPPFLCQQCHMGVDHVSQLPGSESLQSRSPGLMAGSCVNCHSQVHGSNHPSGSWLTR